jgi:hypothetical protein
MRLENCHPWYPHHSDFSCPRCAALLVDTETREDTGISETQNLKCPNCKTQLCVTRNVTVEYLATVTPNAKVSGERSESAGLPS